MKTTSPRNPNAPRVIIADDHELFRTALVLTLKVAGINIIETVSSGRQAVDSTLDHKPDILILDVVMPDLDGLAALSIIKYLAPEIKVVVITSVAEPEYMSRAGELGADAFFSKGVTSKHLINTIHALAKEGNGDFEVVDTNEPSAPSIPCIYLSGEGTTFINEQELTDQEIIVLSLIAMGNDNKSILENLCISKNTLKTHLRNIYAKIGVNDRTQAALWAVRNGFGEQMSIPVTSD
jgi:DNA-binding NarL/FixJ family response regulator